VRAAIAGELLAKGRVEEAVSEARATVDALTWAPALVLPALLVLIEGLVAQGRARAAVEVGLAWRAKLAPNRTLTSRRVAFYFALEKARLATGDEVGARTERAAALAEIESAAEGIADPAERKRYLEGAPA
jgi:hypothetical protein